METVVDTFTAFDENGNPVRIVVFEEQIASGQLKNPGAPTGGMKRVQTEDGKAVNFIDDATFKVVATGQVVRRP